MTIDRSPEEWNLVVRQQEAVARLAQLGLEHDDVERFVADALQTTADVLAVEDVVLFELRGDWDELRGRAGIHRGTPVPRTVLDRLRLAGGSGSFLHFALEQSRAMVSNDLLADDRFRAQAAPRGITVRSAMAAPIRWTEVPYGVFAVYSRVVRAWTPDDVNFLESVAATVGLALQRAQLGQAMRDKSARLDLSLAAGGLGAWSWSMTSDEVVLSPVILDMYGFAEGTFPGTGDAFLSVVHPEDRRALRGDVFEGLQTEGEQHHVFRIFRHDTGELRWIESWGRVLVEGDHQQMVGVSADVTERRRAEQAAEAMLQREHQARVEAEAARERLAFLAESSSRLSSSLELEVTLSSLADLCVPYLADVCLIDLMDDDGQLSEAAAQARDDQSLADVRELRRRRADLGGSGGVYSEREVAHAGQPVMHTTLTDADYQAAAEDEEHLEVFRRFGAHSAVVCPLQGRSGVIGVLSLLCNRPGRAFDHDDLALVQELAARAALALDNGRLFRSRSRVARSLQAALLPPALPVVDGLELAARYQVAEADVEIGGDFYDVIELADGAWAVVVGDVCGRGPDAAAITGLMRHSVRAAVVRERLPSQVLHQTNAAVIHQIDDAKFCTAAFLRVEPPRAPGRSVRVLASSAGHPRPAVVRVDGRAELVPCAGTLLGVVDDPVLVDAEIELGPGDAVVLYTDGVTEARQGTQLFGEFRLLETLSGGGSSAEQVADRLEAAVAAFRGSARDDIAILVLRVPTGPVE